MKITGVPKEVLTAIPIVVIILTFVVLMFKVEADHREEQKRPDNCVNKVKPISK